MCLHFPNQSNSSSLHTTPYPFHLSLSLSLGNRHTSILQFLSGPFAACILVFCPFPCMHGEKKKISSLVMLVPILQLKAAHSQPSFTYRKGKAWKESKVRFPYTLPNLTCCCCMSSHIAPTFPLVIGKRGRTKGCRRGQNELLNSPDLVYTIEATVIYQEL